MKEDARILHIVPDASGSGSGVSQYAATLAARLDSIGRCRSVLVGPDRLANHRCDHVILHYVNYGYQRRGVPFRLLEQLRRLRQSCSGKFVAIFHELYASGPMWKSAFWLRPWQKRIAREIARLADSGIVSNHVMFDQLRKLAPQSCVTIHPVFSNFGEPTLSVDQLANRDVHRWVVCGGTAAIEKSLRSLRASRHHIPEDVRPRELVVFGGSESSTVRAILADLVPVSVHYQPGIPAVHASHLLSGAAFGWLDYFHDPAVPVSVILKSSVFAAYCAHGVIPVFPHRVATISTDGTDRLPGPFFVSGTDAVLPSPTERVQLASDLYHWYHRRAASTVLADAVAELLHCK